MTMKLFAVVSSLALLCGCGALTPTVSNPPTVYSLSGASNPVLPASARPRQAANALTLAVSPPRAAAGFDSPRMMYLRQAEKLEYFAYNEWVDTPARMLAPLIVATLARDGAFRAVVQSPSIAASDLRLETEILRLQQEFLGKPSEIRFTLRAYIVDSATRRVVASRDFESTVVAAADNPRGGVEAARMAVQNVLDDLSAFCARATGGWQPSASR